MYTAAEARKEIEEARLKKEHRQKEEREKQINALEALLAPKLPQKVAEVRPRISQLIEEAVDQGKHSVTIGTEKYFKEGDLNETYILEHLAGEVVMAQLLAQPYCFEINETLVQVSDYEIGRDFNAYRHQWTISWKNECSNRR